MISLPTASRIGLFQQNCAQVCPLHSACGGSPAAPCGCIWASPEKRYRCESCYVLCMERSTPRYSVQQQLSEGRSLDEVRLKQPSAYLPLFIPLGTHESDSPLPLAWAGIDAKTLFNRARKRPVRPKPYLQEDGPIEDRLGLAEGTNLIAVLNGQDWLLEGFWGIDRNALWRLLGQRNFAAVTGPTFSVTREGHGFPAPASHNVHMQRRHHKVIEELQEHGLFAVPNLYWRDEDDLHRWQDWLKPQQSVQIVTRDFSRTKQNPAFGMELHGLCQLLSALKRPMHVLLVGVGPANGLAALQELSGIGCTGSILSSYPVREAVTKGRKLEVSASGQLLSEQDLSIPRPQLIGHNIRAMEHYFIDKVLELPIYRPLKMSLFNFRNRMLGSSESLKLTESVH